MYGEHEKERKKRRDNYIKNQSSNFNSNISPRTRACDLTDSWLPIPHSCCKQRIPLVQVLGRIPLLQAAIQNEK